MLRVSAGLDSQEPELGVSAGTAAILGLHRIRLADAPTTAYMMVGDRCAYDCAFCAQAHSSSSRPRFLSRIAWPRYPVEETLQAVARSFTEQRLVRCCFQVTAAPTCLSQTHALVRRLRSLSPVPINVSIVLADLESVGSLLECGVERVSLALDAACERVYREAKGGDWQRRIDFLSETAVLFPGRVGTHLIAGLGETEQEMATTLQLMVDQQVTIGLFSFTPVAGTLWGRRPPPSLPSYRRVQAANYLLAGRVCRVEAFRFSAEGQIASYGLSLAALRDSLSTGEAFETAGCRGCNRPYYNERPGKVLYNYPRPLKAEEVGAAILAVTAGLLCE